jgi:hypothetical protein
MKQSSLGLSHTTKRTRKREFLDAMELVAPWTELVSLIEPYAPEGGRRGQQPFGVQTLLRIHFMQQWFKLSDPAMEEALHDVPAFRDFAGLSHWDEHIPSESSILRFRHLLERHKLADQILATVNSLLQAKGCPEQLKFVSATRPLFSDGAEAALFATRWALLLGCPEALLAAFAAICLSSGALIPSPPAIDGAPSTGWTAQTVS